MSYIDLVNKLTEKDKTLIANYINEHGINEEFIGVDKWLQDWSHSNQRLYKLLGNQFMKEYDFFYTRNDDEMKSELVNLSGHPFMKNYFYFVNVHIFNRKFGLTYEIKRNFEDLTYLNRSFNNNGELNFPIKFKIEGRKTFQLQKGTKLLKVFYRIMEYFKEDYIFDKASFEDFKIKYSLLMNDKNVKGKMVLSIHPLDYMTMSDNASNWTSCMSWVEQGCYHLGTVEMMNSNNVLVAYLKIGEDDFYFKKGTPAKLPKKEKDPNFSWNDKKWRVLTYITKDIIMTGKAYPYLNDDFCKFIIAKTRELAKENLNWNYSFGPELYKDMIHIDGLRTIENQKYWRKYRPKKYNIIWDTKAMYNDMLNADINYWCYRNKVNKNKIISASGKATCLCCGKQVMELDKGSTNYNDRYLGVDKIVCVDCTNKFFSCEYCHTELYNTDRHTVFSVEKNKNINLCTYHYNEIKECPICKKPFIFEDHKFFTNDYNEKEEEGIFVLEDKYKDEQTPFPEKIRILSVKASDNIINEHTNINDLYSLARLCVCSGCERELEEKAITLPVTRFRPSWYGIYGKTTETNIKVIIDSKLMKYTRYNNIPNYDLNKEIEKIY